MANYTISYLQYRYYDKKTEPRQQLYLVPYPVTCETNTFPLETLDPHLPSCTFPLELLL